MFYICISRMPPVKKPSGAEFRKIRHVRKEKQKNVAHTMSKWILSNSQQDSAASTSQLQTGTASPASSTEDVATTDTQLDRLEENKSDTGEEPVSDAEKNYGTYPFIE